MQGFLTEIRPVVRMTLVPWGAGGAAAFYTDGPLPAEIAAAAQNALNEVSGKFGLMELTDIQGYRAVYRQPVMSKYRGRHVAGMPMPSSGGASLAHVLNYLEAWCAD